VCAFVLAIRVGRAGVGNSLLATLIASGVTAACPLSGLADLRCAFVALHITTRVVSPRFRNTLSVLASNLLNAIHLQRLRAALFFCKVGAWSGGA